MPQLKVTQIKSAIGTKPKHRGTLRALGLGRIGKSHVLPDRPEIRGMLAKVPHLVEVAMVDGDDAAAGSRTKTAPGETGEDQ
jgi:large subunit ribosomal protein L30